MSVADAGGESESEVSRPSIGGPLVLQCSKCRNIVGDTLSLITSEAATGTITLASSSGVRVEGDDIRSDSGNGCTFLPVACVNCRSPLGRVYQQTTGTLDALKNAFCFDCDKLSSYQLGSGSRVGLTQQPTREAGDLRAEVDGLTQEMLRVQQMLLLYHDRISALEGKQ